MGRRVRFFASQIEKEKDVIPIRSLYESAPLIAVGPRAAQTMDELDKTLAEHEQRLMNMNDSYQKLSERTKELVEARHVLRETAVFFEQVRSLRIHQHFLRVTTVLVGPGTPDRNPLIIRRCCYTTSSWRPGERLPSWQHFI